MMRDWHQHIPSTDLRWLSPIPRITQLVHIFVPVLLSFNKILDKYHNADTKKSQKYAISQQILPDPIPFP